MILRRENPFAQLVVPDHQELDRGTLRAIIRQADAERGSICGADLAPYRNAGMTSSPKSRMDFSISAGSMLPKLCVVANRS